MIIKRTKCDNNQASVKESSLRGKRWWSERRFRGVKGLWQPWYCYRYSPLMCSQQPYFRWWWDTEDGIARWWVDEQVHNGGHPMAPDTLEPNHSLWLLKVMLTCRWVHSWYKPFSWPTPESAAFSHTPQLQFGCFKVTLCSSRCEIISLLQPLGHWVRNVFVECLGAVYFLESWKDKRQLFLVLSVPVPWRCWERSGSTACFLHSCLPGKVSLWLLGSRTLLSQTLGALQEAGPTDKGLHSLATLLSAPSQCWKKSIKSCLSLTCPSDQEGTR